MPFPPELLDSPFGEQSRAWILAQHFERHAVVTPENAWLHVYRLLLWIDPTTSLAHCYESDKSQPGRHWYGRTLAFHNFVSGALGVKPRELQPEVDFLFKTAAQIMAEAMVAEQARRDARVVAQRAPFGEDMPLPGENPELAREVETAISTYFGRRPSAELVSSILRMVVRAVAQENKRKNLLGEGFEDALAEVLRRADTAGRYDVHARKLLQELPGFRPPPPNEKPRRVDLCLVHRQTQRRTLVSLKWSVRADREEQFGADYLNYRRNEVWGKPFDFVFVTNEIDAARVVMACTRTHDLVPVFSRVVHLNPALLEVVHPPPPPPAARRARERGGGTPAVPTSTAGERRRAAQLPGLVEEGRLIGLRAWMDALFVG